MKNIVIAVDAMGGDYAPNNVLQAVALSAVRHPYVSFLIFGHQNLIEPIISKMPELVDKYQIIHTDSVISMEEKPSVAIRQKNTSMLLAIEAVRDGLAHGIISGGNTGALMALSKLRLRMIEGINRPSIASLWPTLHGECVVTDLGANLTASVDDLVDFTIMGAEYARIIFDKPMPLVGLLNVGTEEMKGNDTLKSAAAILSEKQAEYGFKYHGFIEGSDICKGTVDVVVTDGFTGNIALKTAEGVAHLISSYLKGSLKSTLISKIGAFLAKKSLMHFKDKVDPRKVNGGVFLGLNGIAVKSHGGADQIAYAAALDLAIDLASGDIINAIYNKIAQRKQVQEKINN
ncbi:MAG: glycerol-3-phosphate acyltransferase PlsX [Dasania sp.]